MPESNNPTMAQDSMTPLKSERDTPIQRSSGNSKGDNNE